MKPFLFLFFLAPALFAAASAQDDYPWGQQLLSLHCQLVPAGPLKERTHYRFSSEFLHTSRLPVYGLPRTLIKPLGFGYYLQDSSGSISFEAEWDALYHSEAGHPFYWDPGDLRLHTTVHLLKKGPFLSMRYGTKLPNAPNNYSKDQLYLNGGMSGAGSDNTDFSLTFLLSQAVGLLMVDGNFGILILGSPTGYSEQLDVYHIATGLRYLREGFTGSLESNLTFGPRRFDDYREVAFKVEYSFKGVFVGLRQSFGLNRSTDDIQSRVFFGRRKGM